MTDRALSVREVAAMLCIRTHGILSLIHQGELQAVDVSLVKGGRPRWRIMPDDLDGFLLRRKYQTPVRQRRRKRINDMPCKTYF